jgi:hypothetical protein
MAQAHRRIGAAAGAAARAAAGSGVRAAAWLWVACAFGCASSPHPAPSAPPPGAPAQALPGASYAWRPLIVVPFGTLLKDMPLALDEVLMFHDAAATSATGAPAAAAPAAGSANDAESGDCFSLDGASPPQFLGLRPDPYLLCFEHDRLHRIEASVQLAAGDAARLLDGVCAQWLGSTEDRARTPDGCTGSEGGVLLSVRLTPGAESSATLSITLVDAGLVPRE